VTARTALPGEDRHSPPVRSAIFQQRFAAVVTGRLGGVAVAVGLLACAGLQAVFQEPAVSLERAAVRSVGVTGGSLDLVIGVYNPNPFDLRGTRLQLGLDVEDSHVGDVDYSSEFQAQKGDTTVLTLPLSFRWNGLAAAATTALGTGELPYTLKGQLSVTTPIGPQQVAFTHQGRAPLSRIGGIIQPSIGR
jgi:LEA14-like dessication related protein